MSNSSLVNYTKLSPSHSGKRNHVIDTISIHCMAGNLTIESCGNVFQNRQASSNYGIGSDGRIGLYVDEANRTWCTSSASNDNRAVTIEVANDGGASTGWHVSDKAYASLIALVADICKRNNIKELKWQGNKSLIGNIEQQNMTVHRWFSAKACPGDYLYNLHGDIAKRVNAILNKEEDDLAKYIEQIANQAGVSTDEVVKRLANLVKYDNTTEEDWEKTGYKNLTDLGLVSGTRQGNQPVFYGELGIILKRFKDTFIK